MPTCTTRLCRRATRSHPAALFDENGERLFDVDILAGGAGHHRHQGVPVIGRADDHGLQVLVVEHAAEVGIRFGAAPARRDALFQARLVDVAHGGKIGVLLILEIEDVLGADQAVADEADLHAVIGAEQPAIGECAECGGAERGAPRGIRWVHADVPLCDGALTKCKYTSRRTSGTDLGIVLSFRAD